MSFVTKVLPFPKLHSMQAMACNFMVLYQEYIVSSSGTDNALCGSNTKCQLPHSANLVKKKHCETLYQFQYWWDGSFRSPVDCFNIKKISP